MKYVKNEDIIKEIKLLYRKHKVKNVLYYKKDMTLKRFLTLKRRNHFILKKYQKYYK